MTWHERQHDFTIYMQEVCVHDLKLVSVVYLYNHNGSLLGLRLYKSHI